MRSVMEPEMHAEEARDRRGGNVHLEPVVCDKLRKEPCTQSQMEPISDAYSGKEPKGSADNIMAEREFKIKVGTLRRVKKDLEYYAKEHEAQTLKIEKMRADNKDEYDIKKQQEVLVETEMMLPDCQMRLKEAATDVTNFWATHKEEIDPLELTKEAQALLNAVPPLLQ